MTFPYADIGAKLVERGFAALPIMPGTKRPGSLRGGQWWGMNKWREEYTRRLPTRIEVAQWSATEAGVCVVTGPASHHLVAFDIDTEDPAIDAAIRSVLPYTEVRKAGAKGETLFYLGTHLEQDAEHTTLSPSWNINKQRVLDLIGPGRQTVLPPTIHPDTDEPYRWTGEAALQDIDPSDLVELPPDIITQINEALRPLGWEPKQQPAAPSYTGGGDANSPWRDINVRALANLSAWVPGLGLCRCKRTAGGYEAVPVWRASNTGRRIEVRKLNLQINAKGINDFGDGPKGYTAIDLVMVALSVDFDTAFKYLDDRVGEHSVVINLKPKRDKNTTTDELPLDALTEAASEPEMEPVPEQPEATETVPADARRSRTMEELANCEGLIGKMVRWVTATARRPMPTLSLACSIGVMGTLMGRRVSTPTDGATHLYIIGLGSTGSGKNHPLACSKRLLKAAGAEAHIGPNEFVSQQGLSSFLLRSPLALCPQDEFGAFLKRANGKKASGFEGGLSKDLRTLWGTGFEPYATSEAAGRKSEIIHAPALSLFGMSTHAEFYESLQGNDIHNGFLNRFLIFEAGARVEDTDPSEDTNEVPPDIAAGLRDIYQWGDGIVGTTRQNDSTCQPAPRRVNWTNERAKATFKDFSREMDKEMKNRPEQESFYTRAAEMAVKLATIYAAGRWSFECTVDVEAMEWGRDIANLCVRRVAEAASAHMITEMSHGQVAVTIIDVIKKNGGTALRAKIMKALEKSVKSTKALDDSLGVLIEAGTIEKRGKRPPAGGPEVVHYSLKAA